MTTSPAFRLIDSGVREGRLQIAYDAALTELHAAGRVPDTVRFMRFPPTVLIGRHQILPHEVHVDRCHAEGVGLVRRVSGGGAIYLDEGQVGWELVYQRSALRGRIPGGTLGEHAKGICEAVAAGLAKTFAIDARFRPRNDIEAGGRKLGGTGGYFVGDTLVYQGTVLIDMDASRMARLLNIPASKLARHDAANATSRVVTLRELLGRSPSIDEVHAAILEGLSSSLGITTTPAPPTPEEDVLTQRHFTSEIGTDDFVFGPVLFEPAIAAAESVLHASRTCPGGTITAHLRLEGAGPSRRVREIMLTGDFFVAPPRAVFDLEARLRGVLVAEIAATVDAFFEKAGIGLLSLAPHDFREVILAAAAST